jgi:hypothetical protein
VARFPLVHSTRFLIDRMLGDGGRIDGSGGAGVI